jgi:hypothetical protein
VISKHNEKFITKDTEMKEPDKTDLSKDNEVSTDLLRKFNKANVNWKRWITLDEVKGWELSTIPGATASWNTLSETKRKSHRV